MCVCASFAFTTHTQADRHRQNRQILRTESLQFWYLIRERERERQRQRVRDIKRMSNCCILVRRALVLNYELHINTATITANSVICNLLTIIYINTETSTTNHHFSASAIKKRRLVMVSSRTATPMERLRSLERKARQLRDHILSERQFRSARKPIY